MNGNSALTCAPITLGYTTSPAATFCTIIKQPSKTFTLSFDPEETPPAELIGRIAANYEIRDLFVENPPIEEIIARLYEDVNR